MDQISLFGETKFWIPEEDNGCRMWKCPDCGRRMIGEPLRWSQYCHYRFCPYCGVKLFVKKRLVNHGGDNVL